MLRAALNARGLFNRTIAHSPGGALLPPPDEIPKLSQALGGALGDDLVARLRALPAREFLAIQLATNINYMASIDGAVITGPYVRAIRERHAGDVPMISGTAHDEGTFLREAGATGRASRQRLRVSRWRGSTPAPIAPG